jgi:hypothetical protein
MSFYSRNISGGYFELTKQIAQLRQIIFKILNKLKLEFPSSSFSSSSSSSSSELEKTDDVSFIENFENRIKSIEELKIEENLKSVLDNLKEQLSSIEKLSEDSQDYLSKDTYEKQIETYLPAIPNTLSSWLPGGASVDFPNTLFRYFDIGFYVYTKTEPIIPMLEINKGYNYIQIGDYYNNHPETELHLCGNKLWIKIKSNEISMILGNNRFNFNYNQTQINIGDGFNDTIIEHGYQLNFDENKDFLIQRSKKERNEVVNRLFFSCGLNFRNALDNLEISKSGSEVPTALEKITIPYGIDLTSLQSRFNY